MVELDAKDIVLARADITDPQVTKHEITFVCDKMMEMYTTPHGVRLIQAFNNDPDNFDFEKYSNQCRSIEQ